MGVRGFFGTRLYCYYDASVASHSCTFGTLLSRKTLRLFCAKEGTVAAFKTNVAASHQGYSGFFFYRLVSSPNETYYSL